MNSNQERLVMESPATFKVPANLGGGVRNDDDDDDEVKAFKHRVNEVSRQVVKLQQEQKIHEIEQFYSSNQEKQLRDSINNSSRGKDKRRHATSRQKQLDCNASFKRMQDLIRQFGIILNQLTQKRNGACSSLDSVDLNGLILNESVVGKPRDFKTIKKRLEAKDDSGYNHVREIYYDVRWILKTAIKYNDVRSDAHVTAKTLLEKFEQKWLLLLPKVMQEEGRREEEAGLKQTYHGHLTKEEAGLKQTYHAQMTKDVICELNKLDMRLKELREDVLRRCRMSTREKNKLGRGLAKLSGENLLKALEIVAQENPSFQSTAEEVEVDIDNLSESTLRRLKCFVVEKLVAQAKDESKNKQLNGNTAVDTSKALKSKPKRKRQSVDAVAKKRTKKGG
ncbi:transcription factor GTE6 isoform X2 [Spinacia oleracea]|uniref:Transcription factor GTE6 isoform X2 n=1 Tax=Spinacia oleracea TaxID=3562 RepID=A0A9R0KBX9_SPIOL|nr:transcription factor GTE6-like isoform X2 [Spinacia oleracea]